MVIDANGMPIFAPDLAERYADTRASLGIDIVAEAVRGAIIALFGAEAWAQFERQTWPHAHEAERTKG
jgi:hypothetical protein